MSVSPPRERRLATLRSGWNTLAPTHEPRPVARQTQREEQLPEQRQRRHRLWFRFRFRHFNTDVRKLTGRLAGWEALTNTATDVVVTSDSLHINRLNSARCLNY